MNGRVHRGAEALRYIGCDRRRELENIYRPALSDAIGAERSDR